MKYLLAIAACVLTLAPGPSFAQPVPTSAAQAWPVRPLRFVVPYTAGGNTDMIARTLGQKLSESLGQPVVVENRAGAATLIGAENVAKAPPDGYALLLATSTTLAINPHLYKSLPYDPIRDFTPVIQVARIPMVLLVPPTSSIRTLQDLVAQAKAKPGELTYATAGPGSPSDLAMQLFLSATGTKMTAVPYKGGSPAMVDLMAGHVNVAFDNSSLNLVRAGKLRAIFQSGEKRMPIAPEIPTVVELGLAQCVFYPWQGVMVPAGTPPSVVARLHDELYKALQLPDVRARITADGAEISAGSSGEFTAYIRSELDRFGRVMREVGVKPE
jgi:tripartite-type tricarboxylate transporter receptor subunit TctC